jgi:hypothetical protein
MAETRYINVEPDGLFTAAWNVTQTLINEGVIKPTKKHPEGEILQLVFVVLTANREHIKKSSWITGERVTSDADND